PALHAGGQRFDPARLHHYTTYYYLSMNLDDLWFFCVINILYTEAWLHFIVDEENAQPFSAYQQ
ncbi:MAG: hypothetical protein ACI35P_16990, partial [Bacillus sp. (in: firmicutes)]